MQDKNQNTADFAAELRDKKVYIDMCKNAGRPKMIAESRMNHMLKYHEECERRGALPLPILFKVRNKYLHLIGYGLNKGLC